MYRYAPSPFYTFSAGIMLVESLAVQVLQALGDVGREHLAAWEMLRGRELVTDDAAAAGGRSAGS